MDITTPISIAAATITRSKFCRMTLPVSVPVMMFVIRLSIHSDSPFDESRTLSSPSWGVPCKVSTLGADAATPSSALPYPLDTGSTELAGFFIAIADEGRNISLRRTQLLRSWSLSPLLVDWTIPSICSMSRLLSVL